MQLKTILNRVHKHRSFVYEADRLYEECGRLRIDVDVRPRANGRPKCSGCGRPRPGYDTLSARRFEFIPILGIAVYFVYAMRRVDCPNCGIVVEEVPWGSGKHQATTTYAWFLAGWAKRLSWSTVAEAFQTSWDRVFRSVDMAVTWGLEHRDLDDVIARLIEKAPYDQLQLQRLKKRKLRLKDVISRIVNDLRPDIIA